MMGGFGAGRGDVLRIFDGDSVAGLNDGDLLVRFARRRDEAAFEALVARLGPMVLGTCRRMLADPHDVDDAFQATFLVLVRRARSIRNPDLVGPWLHGVATKVARRARADALRRADLERRGSVEEAREFDPGLEGPEIRSRIDEEIDRLPESQRRLIVLCDVEGLGREEAAARLGWSLNMVRGRLARARSRLRGRLARRGLAPHGAWIISKPTPPPALVASTAQVSLSTGAGGFSAPAVALSRGVLRMMGLSKWKLPAALALGAAVAWAGVLAATGTPIRPAVEQDRPAAVPKAARPPDAPGPEAPESVPVRVSGFVRDSEGRAVPGATVQLLGSRELVVESEVPNESKVSFGTAVAATTRADRDGFYRLAGVKIPTSRNERSPQGRTPYADYWVVVTAPGFGIGWHQGQSMYAVDPPDPDDIQRRLRLGESGTMDVQLRPEADLRGRVVDEAGRPLAGVKLDLREINLLDDRGVELDSRDDLGREKARIMDPMQALPGDPGRAVTGADGRFRLTGLPSESCCVLFLERPGSKLRKMIHASTSARDEEIHDLPNNRGRHRAFPRVLETAMPSTVRLEVRVVADDDGKPVPGARLSSIGDSPETGFGSSGVADAEGRVDLELPVGRYHGLMADPSSTGSRFVRTRSGEFEVAATPKVQPREFRMKPGCELLLEAVDAGTGRGLPGIMFQIKPEGLDVRWETVQPSTFQAENRWTGPDGKYRALLQPASGKQYRVRVCDFDQAGRPYVATPEQAEPFEPTSGKTITLRFTVRKKD